MGSSPAHILRDADWLTAERARVYGAMVAVGLAIMALWLLLAPLRPGIPGGDFVSFYAASLLALGGHPAAAWTPEVHAAAEQAVLGAHPGYLAFLYPPPYLLACWPLALLPFGASFWVWTGSTLTAALLAFGAYMRQIVTIRYLALVLLGLPAIWINVLAGQNGALSLAILAAGFALIGRRPISGGFVLGLMVIKPQLALAVPFVLMASGRWRSLLAAAVGAGMMLVLAWPAVGTEGYLAFVANSANARAALEGGAVDPALMQSIFGMLQPLSPLVAYVGQVLVSAAVLLVACVAARRTHPDGAALGALGAAATLAATPFLLDYDLALAALPIGWIVAQGIAAGFRPWEKIACLVCAALPLLARALSMGVGLHLAPLMSILLFLLVTRRIVEPAATGDAPLLVASRVAG